MIIFYVTCKNKKEAEEIAKSLLNKKIIACANFFPIKSMYHWNKKISKDSEFVLILKTTANNRKAAEEEIRKIHSYKLPCILALNVDANKEFQAWAGKEVR